MMFAPSSPQIEQCFKAAMPSHYRHTDDMDPARDGLTLVKMQRSVRAPGDTASAVGAFVQVTSVYERGISTNIVHRWPEEWGEPTVNRLADLADLIAVPSAEAAA
jgi:hypothetical protein